jgi:hypothetical protein
MMENNTTNDSNASQKVQVDVKQMGYPNVDIFII